MPSAEHPAPAAARFFHDRSPWFWAVFGAVFLTQVVALWMVCSHQVAQARERHAAAVAHQQTLLACRAMAGRGMQGCQRDGAVMQAALPAAGVDPSALAVRYQR